MSLDTVQGSLDKIGYELKDIEERREKLIKGTRDIILSCSKSIVALHHGQIKEADRLMRHAKTLLDELRTEIKNDLYKYIVVAEQELVEAFALKSLVIKERLPGIDELSVSGPSYITGLLDCIGEIKRMVYDKLRAGASEEASTLFATMQEIYSAVYPFAVYDNIVQGTRRKLDVAKLLIEDIRAVITEESRRAEMIKTLQNLEQKLK